MAKQNMDKELRALATPKFVVSVTSTEINRSIPKNSGHCMIADAVKKCFKDKFKRAPYAVHVDLQTIRLTDSEKGFRYIYFTPAIGQAQLLNFDWGKEVRPFKFRLKGGQIVPIFKYARGKTTPIAKKKAKENTKAIKRFKTARLRITTAGKGNINSVTKIGGNEPPAAVLAGKRREFGLKLSLKPPPNS
jgi:hypothetical protein